MASATVSHPAVTDRPSTPVRPEQTAAPAPRQESYEETTARETKQLVMISAVAVVIVLVVFFALITILAGYGPGPVESAPAISR